MSEVKRFKLERVGAGPGVALFSCEHLLGVSVEVVAAADYEAVAADAARYRYLRTNRQFNTDRFRLEWYLPRWHSGNEGLAERLDKTIDAAIREISA